MKNVILGLGFLVGFTNAFAAPSVTFEGKYVNAAYNGPHGFQAAWVEIRTNDQKELELIFNVPCLTKLTARTFKMNDRRDFKLNDVSTTTLIDGTLEVINEGAGQCDTGKNPKIFLDGDSLSIITEPRIRTPGFDGVYILTRQ